MKEHIEFLENRLKEIERKLFLSPEYKEMKALKLVLSTMEPPKCLISPSISVLERQALATVYPEATYTRGGYTKRVVDMTNSPMPHARWGTRIARMYELIEKIVQENGGEIELPLLVEYLKESNGMDWDDGDDSKGHPRMKHSRLVSYIRIYNKAHPEDTRLALWPQKPEGMKKARAYQKIVYVGKAA